jgi:hypothetical protein
MNYSAAEIEAIHSADRVLSCTSVTSQAHLQRKKTAMLDVTSKGELTGEILSVFPGQLRAEWPRPCERAESWFTTSLDIEMQLRAVSRRSTLSSSLSVPLKFYEQHRMALTVFNPLKQASDADTGSLGG